jgi:hypothetical protein
MTPTPPEDTTSGSAGPRAQAAAITPTPPRSGVRRARRRSHCPARPATVWQCGGDDPRDGTAVLSGWLLNAIVKIVTGYSKPGDRVLLLTPPPTPTGPVRWTRVGRGTGPYDGLHEAAWTVARLGRGIQTRTTHPARADADFALDTDPVVDPEPPEGPRSDPGPHPRNARGRQPARAEFTTAPAAESPPPGAERDRFDLVITTVAPDHPDWTRDTDFNDMLTPHGITAIITHSDNCAGRLTDPTGRLVSTLREGGLGWLDHVILLETLPDPGHRRVPGAARHRRVHHDLLLFARPPGPCGDGGAERGEDHDA